MVRRVPRVARRWERQVEAGAAKGEFMRRKLAEDDRAGLAQLGDHHRVGRLDVVEQNFRVAGGGQAGDVDDVLDADRHAVQRAADVAGGDLALRGAGGIQRGVGVQVDEDVELRVELFDARQQGLQELDGGELAGGEGACGLGGGEPVQLGHMFVGHGPPPARIGGQGSSAGSKRSKK